MEVSPQGKNKTAELEMRLEGAELKLGFLRWGKSKWNRENDSCCKNWGPVREISGCSISL